MDRAAGSNRNMVGGLPPVDSPVPTSRRKPSSMRSRTMSETLALVSPVSLATSARLVAPAS